MLNRHEKFAVFNLSLVVIATLLCILIWQIKGITAAPAGFAILGLIAFGQLLFLRKKNSADIVEDERDRSIKIKAALAGYSNTWFFFVIAVLTVYFTHSEGGVISVEYLPLFLWVGWAVHILTTSVITLIQYRKGTNCGIC